MVSVGLPDVNVLIALSWPSHVHHLQSRRWFELDARTGWATCPFTQAGFTRISSNPKIMVHAVSPREALLQLRKLTLRGRHFFWADDLDLSQDSEVPTDLLMGHQQMTDAYLLGLAIRRGGETRHPGSFYH